jgi:hypothetical protein
MFGTKESEAYKDPRVDQIVFKIDILRGEIDKQQQRLRTSEAFANVERAKEMEQRWRARVQDCQDFMQRIMLRMDAIATENRELISDNYEMKRFLQVLGLEIKARANGGGSVAPPAPSTE